MFVRAYNETRHSVAYMRRDEGDVDQIIPSLYAARGARTSTARREKRTKGIAAQGDEQALSLAPISDNAAGTEAIASSRS